MSLFWYGKKILVKIFEIQFLEEKFRMSVILSNNQHKVLHYTGTTIRKTLI